MSMSIVSTDSPQEVTKALGMYSEKKTGETQQTSAQAAQETEVQAEESTASETETEATEASESESEQTSTDDESGVDDSDGEQTQDAGDQAADKNAGKGKKGGFQRRIDKITKQRAQAEQERDLLREENLRLKQAQVPPKETAQGQQAAAAEAAGKPVPDSYASVAEYMEALTDWKIEQREKKSEIVKKTEQAKTSFHNKMQEFHKKSTEFHKATADFNEVAAEFDETYPSGMPHAMLDMFADSDHGPQMMYEIAKDHSEFERLKGLSPIQLAREIGKREAKFSDNPGVKQPQKNTTTKAPAPMKPVKGSAAVSNKNPGDMNMAEYNAWRDAGGGR